MYRRCCYLLLGNFFLSFLAKGTIIFHSAHETTWYRGMPFCSWQIDFPQGINWHFVHLSGNIAVFVLLWAALKFHFSHDRKWLQNLSCVWLLILLAATNFNIYSHAPYPSFLALQLLFWGYAMFSGLTMFFYQTRWRWR